MNENDFIDEPTLEFEGWGCDELKEEIHRLQKILDRNKIEY